MKNKYALITRSLFIAITLLLFANITSAQTTLQAPVIQASQGSSDAYIDIDIEFANLSELTIFNTLYMQLLDQASGEEIYSIEIDGAADLEVQIASAGGTVNMDNSWSLPSIQYLTGPEQTHTFSFDIFQVGFGASILAAPVTATGFTTSFEEPNLQVLSQPLYDQIKLEWTANSDLNGSYNIYRNGILIANVSGSENSYEDFFYVPDPTSIPISPPSIQNGESYTYCLETYSTDLFESYPGDQSICADGGTLPINLEASRDAFSDKVVLNWNLLNELCYEDLQIKRDSETLSLPVGCINSYSDLSPIPGKAHVYTLSLLDDAGLIMVSVSDTGSIASNGSISGNVSTLLNDFAIVNAELTATLTLGSQTYTETTSSDLLGNYLFDSLYYSESATYNVAVNYLGHSFVQNPIPVLLSLDTNSRTGVDFKDQSLLLIDSLEGFTDVEITAIAEQDVLQISWSYIHDTELTTFFQIYRNGELVELIDDVGGAVSVYNDYGGDPGTVYNYLIRAYRILSETSMSKASFPLTGTFPAQSPVMLENFSATADATAGIMNLTWTHESENFTGFRLYRDEELIHTSNKMPGHHSESEYSFVDLHGLSGVPYEYSLVVFRDTDITWTSESVTQSEEYPLMTPPYDLMVAEQPDKDWIQLTWDYPEALEFSYNYDGHELLRIEYVPGLFLTIDTVVLARVQKGFPKQYNDYSGHPGTGYTYIVRSYRENEGVFTYSNESFTDPENTNYPLLTAPTGLNDVSGMETLESSIDLEWNEHSSENYTGFVLIREMDTVAWLPAGTDHYTDLINLPASAGNTFDYYLHAYAERDGVLYFSASNESPGTRAIAESPLQAVQNFTASDNYSNHVKLCWDYPEYILSSFFITRDGDLITPENLPIGTRTYFDYGAVPGSDYIYQIRASYDGIVPPPLVSPIESEVRGDHGEIADLRVIHGVATTSAGLMGIQGAQVQASASLDDGNELFLTTTTDEAGYYRFENIPSQDGLLVNLSIAATNHVFDPDVQTQTVTLDDALHYTVNFPDIVTVSADPSDLIAQPYGTTAVADPVANAVVIQWNTSNANFDHFEVYRGFTKLGQVNAGEILQWTDFYGNSGHEYLYQVRAHWNSDLSEVDADGAIFPALLPAENLVATPVPLENAVKLQWSHPYNQHTGYIIIRDDIIIETLLNPEEGGIVLEYIDATGLPNRSYPYHVVAMDNSSGVVIRAESVSTTIDYPPVYPVQDGEVTITNQLHSNIVTISSAASNFDGYVLYNNDRFVGYDFTLTDGQGQILDTIGIPGMANSYSIAAVIKDPETDLFIESQPFEYVFNYPVVLKPQPLESHEYFSPWTAEITSSGFGSSIETNAFSTSETTAGLTYTQGSKPLIEFKYQSDPALESGGFFNNTDGFEIYRLESDALFDPAEWPSYTDNWIDFKVSKVSGWDMVENSSSLQQVAIEDDYIPDPEIYLAYAIRAYSMIDGNPIYSDILFSDLNEVGTLVPPTNFVASDGTFASYVALSWDYNGNDHDGFKIYRDGDVISEDVDPGLRTYPDLGATGEHTYHIEAFYESFESSKATDNGSVTPNSFLFNGDFAGEAVAIGEQYAAIGIGSGFSSATGCIGCYIQPKVRMYKKVGQTWEFMQTIVNPASIEYQFGFSLDIDGNQLVIGAPNSDPAGQGKVYVYELNETGTDWEYLEEFDGFFAGFGYSVAIEDNYMAAANPFIPDLPIYLFSKSSGVWGYHSGIQPHGLLPIETLSSPVEWLGASLEIDGGFIYASHYKTSTLLGTTTSAQALVRKQLPDGNETLIHSFGGLSKITHIGFSLGVDNGSLIAGGPLTNNSVGPTSFTINFHNDMLTALSGLSTFTDGKVFVHNNSSSYYPFPDLGDAGTGYSVDIHNDISVYGNPNDTIVQFQKENLMDPASGPIEGTVDTREKTNYYGLSTAIYGNWALIGGSGIAEFVNLNQYDGLVFNSDELLQNVEASDGTGSDVEVTWTVGNADSILRYDIYRDNVKQITSPIPPATSYSDNNDVIPGKKYVYSVVAVKSGGRESNPVADIGWAKPNGILEGSVQSIDGGAVVGATISWSTNVSGEIFDGSVLTDEDGEFKIEDLYYGEDGSEFTLTVSYEDHDFIDDTKTEMLTQLQNIKSNILFIDNTAKTISGTVYYSGLPCSGIEGVKVELFGKIENTTVTSATIDEYPIAETVTGADGKYFLNVDLVTENLLDYVLKIESFHTEDDDQVIHLFDRQEWSYKDDHLLIENPVAVFDVDAFPKLLDGIDFVDLLKYTVELSVESVCGPIKADCSEGSEEFHVNIRSDDLCIDLTSMTSTDAGKIMLDLPPLDYLVTVTGVAAPSSAINPIVDYLSARPSSIKIRDKHKTFEAKLDELSIEFPGYSDADLETAVVASFNEELATSLTYHKTPLIELGPNTSMLHMCSPGLDSDPAKPFYVVQGEPYLLEFNISEIFCGYECEVNSGYLKVTNNAASVSTLDTIRYDQEAGDFPSIVFIAGNPNTIAPYTQTLVIKYYADNDEFLGEKLYSVFVEGKRALPGSDVIVDNNVEDNDRGFQFPLFILRDPPGDHSFSEISSGKTISKTMTLSSQESFSGGFVTEGLFAISKVGAWWNVSIEAGGTWKDEQQYNYEVTTTTTVTTSEDPDDIGENADIVMGAGLAMAYGIIQSLELDENCDPVIKSELGVSLNGISTTWLYTVGHIKLLIEEFEQKRQDGLAGILTVYGIDDGDDPEAVADYFNTYKENWEKLLEYHQYESLPHFLLCKKEDGEYVLPFDEDRFVLQELDIDGGIGDDDNEITTVHEEVWAFRKDIIEDYKAEVEPSLDEFCPLIMEEDPANPGTQILKLDPDSTFGIKPLRWNETIRDKYNEVANKVQAAQKAAWDRSEAFGSSIYFYEQIAAFELEYQTLYGLDATNYTISGGTSISNSSSVERSKNETISQTDFLKSSIAGGLLFKEGTTFGVGTQTNLSDATQKAGGKFTLDISNSQDIATSTTLTTSSSYTLTDDDSGDQLSITVVRGSSPTHTPYFQLFAGRTSCPYEDGTIARDDPSLQLFDPLENPVSDYQYDVPPDELASFWLQLGNLNPFTETRDYELLLDQSSNPYGAIVRANGVQLGVNKPIYSIPPDEPLYTLITVERGPEEYIYEGLTLGLRSTCATVDVVLETSGLTDYVELNVEFIEPCSEIAISDPVDGWVINGADDDTLFVKITDYDIYNDGLDSVVLEYRREGSNDWHTIVSLDSETVWDYYFEFLTTYPEPLYNVEWMPEEDVLDGNYNIRSRAVCGVSGETISELVAGVIDRTPPKVLGTPQPADQVLDFGDEISITYDETLDCPPAIAGDVEFSLINTDDGGADLSSYLSFSCYENKLVFSLSTALNLPDLLSDKLELTVEGAPDQYGNLSASHTWSFYVLELPACDASVTVGGLEATVLTPTKVRLDWDAVPNSLGYQVKGALDIPDQNPVWATVVTTNNFKIVNGLSAGATYIWKVRTMCESFEVSGFSETATFTMTLPAARSAEILRMVEVMPNPVIDQMRVSLSGFEGEDVHLEVSNITGQLIWSEDIRVTDILHEEHINEAANWMSGVYMVSIVSGDYRVTEKFVKIE